MSVPGASLESFLLVDYKGLCMACIANGLGLEAAHMLMYADVSPALPCHGCFLLCTALQTAKACILPSAGPCADPSAVLCCVLSGSSKDLLVNTLVWNTMRSGANKVLSADELQRPN